MNTPTSPTTDPGVLARECDRYAAHLTSRNAMLDAADLFARCAIALRCAPEPREQQPSESLTRRTVEFLGTWRDAGPECECEAPGHTCGWPKLRDLADEWRALTKKLGL